MLPVGAFDFGGEMPSWVEVRDFAERAESLGLDSLWVYDHFYSNDQGQPLLGIHEPWALLSALAVTTSKADLGLLVACTGYRTPGVIAKLAVTIDELSDGRLILGLGAGWHDEEYVAFGYPTDQKVSRFAEAMDIISGLLRGEAVTYEGRFYRTSAAELLPRPARQIPVLIAGRKPRMLSLTARHADAWNTAWYQEPNAKFEGELAGLRQAMEAEGRDPKDMRITAGIEIADAESEEATRMVERVRTAWAGRADELLFYLLPTTVRSLERLAAGLG
jgi:probable F420-dependent oxidoreductase